MTEAARIPSGTVTLLFTDVEGSTRLWESEPDQMAVALRRHDEILRGAVGESGGYVFKTVGDAFCAAFSTADGALAAVLVSQRALTTQAWPTSRPVRVRMALHTGVCEERDNDYFGPVVNRTARLEAIAHGGQVLLSGATAELLSESLPPGVSLRDLGHHRLKDLGRPEQVFQLEATFLPADFPPLASLDNPELPNNLPSVLTAFIGRDAELQQVTELARTARLVTLTGAGGSGKTRLALQAAAELIDTAPDGVWLAELAPLTDGEQIAGLIAGVLGIPESGRPRADVVIEALAGQDALILLDNCEHLIDAAAKFCDQLIRHCPKVAILATSREPLGLDGEHVYRVPSLSLPAQDADTAEAIGACDAVRLFAERARIHHPGFVLDDADAPLAASICRRLDGIPLALELAAARLSSMSLQQVSERLDQRFRLLTGGSRNAMPRQQTLQATVEWSFGLLTTPERETLARLSVFSGGFDLDAAEAVCASADIDVFDVIDLLGSLVDRSLLVAEHSAGSVRYRQLETIRQYCAQELIRAAGDGEAIAVRDRHAEFYVRLAETAAPALAGGREQARWLRRLDTEWDNLRLAVAHLRTEERSDDLLRVGVALFPFVISRGHVEVLDGLRHALDRADPAPSSILAEALVTASWLTWAFRNDDAGEAAVARQYAERGLAMARELGDRQAEGRALKDLALAAFYTERDHAAVRQLAEEAMAIARQADDIASIGMLVSLLGAITPSYDERSRLYQEALAYCQRSGDLLLAASVQTNLFGIDLRFGRLSDARARIQQAIADAEELGAVTLLAGMLAKLGILMFIQGEPDMAVPAVRRALLLTRRIGDPLGVTCDLLLAAACCASWQDQPQRAARLHGAAETARTGAIELGTFEWTDPELRLHEQDQARLRALLGEDCYGDAYRAGAGLSPVQAVELALSRGE
ncbi:MAG TPA: adenylate/guanylate cyclase domain-containing protein [Streptosporangiaceae bacterium]|nr:adenylate/guanylate cyclase domain-containing protein [Streptosporangiaceae bacterium]